MQSQEEFDIKQVIIDTMIDALIQTVKDEWEIIDEYFAYHKIVGNKKWLAMSVKESDELVVDKLQELFDGFRGKPEMKSKIIQALEEMKKTVGV